MESEKGHGLKALAVLCAMAAAKADADPALSLYGMPGVFDMPTARHLEDGALGLTFGGFADSSRASIGFQAAPRIFAAFRYSRIGGFFADGSSLYDRSFDLSFLLLTETESRPALVLGFQDFVGTGVFGAEYLVATKSFGDFTVSAGLGWGRFGTYGSLGSPFGDRPEPDIALGGQLNYDQWFRGPVAPFGNIEWRVSDRLTFLAEYSSDAYVTEESLGLLEQDIPINVGLRLRTGQSGALSAGLLYGSEISLQYSFVFNPRYAPVPSGSEPALNLQFSEAGADMLPGALRDNGIALQGVAIEGDTATLVIRNLRFGAMSQAVGRSARIAAALLPDTIGEFVIVLETERGLPTTGVVLSRTELEALEFAGSQAIFERARIVDAATIELPPEQAPALLTWGLAPYVKISLFDPAQPVRADLGLILSGRAEFGSGFVATGAVEKRIVGNLDQLRTESSPGLPPVRSDFTDFVADGDPGIAELTLAHYSRPAPDVFARVTGGYLEDMYGGLSGEILWKPVDSPLGLGLELNYARKRETDRLFGFQDFDTVTGHLSAYYDFGAGYNVEVHGGRYLAGDVGATVVLSRRFANGWELGAYVTRTDASFEDFGEGSYDKGLRLVIPLDWFNGAPSRNRIDTTLRSLGRDGGARLEVPGRLYDLVKEADRATLDARWGRFWR